MLCRHLMILVHCNARDGQGPGNADALSLSAAELEGEIPAPFQLEPHFVQELRHFRCTQGLSPTS